jgi:hypothetical protein
MASQMSACSSVSTPYSSILGAAMPMQSNQCHGGCKFIEGNSYWDKCVELIEQLIWGSLLQERRKKVLPLIDERRGSEDSVLWGRHSYFSGTALASPPAALRAFLPQAMSAQTRRGQKCLLQAGPLLSFAKGKRLTGFPGTRGRSQKSAKMDVASFLWGWSNLAHG